MAAVDDDGLHEADKQHVEDKLEWVPLSLTLVEYPRGKPIFIHWFSEYACQMYMILLRIWFILHA